MTVKQVILPGLWHKNCKLLGLQCITRWCNYAFWPLQKLSSKPRALPRDLLLTPDPVTSPYCPHCSCAHCILQTLSVNFLRTCATDAPNVHTYMNVLLKVNPQPCLSLLWRIRSLSLMKLHFVPFWSLMQYQDFCWFPHFELKMRIKTRGVKCTDWGHAHNSSREKERAQH